MSYDYILGGSPRYLCRRLFGSTPPSVIVTRLRLNCSRIQCSDKILTLDLRSCRRHCADGPERRCRATEGASRPQPRDCVDDDNDDNPGARLTLRVLAAVVALSAVVPLALGTIATHILPGGDGLLRGCCVRWPWHLWPPT